MSHRHLFEDVAGGTRMIDQFFFRAPLGILGRIAEGLFLSGYMRRFLEQRNAVLKELAETSGWRDFLE